MAKTCAGCGLRPAVMGGEQCRQCLQEASDEAEWLAIQQSNERVHAVLRQLAPDVRWAHIGVGYTRPMGSLESSLRLWAGRAVLGVLADVMAGGDDWNKATLWLAGTSTDDRFVLISLGEAAAFLGQPEAKPGAQPAVVLDVPLRELQLALTGRAVDPETRLDLKSGDGETRRVLFRGEFLEGNQAFPLAARRRQQALLAGRGTGEPAVRVPLTRDASARLLRFWRSSWLAWRSGRLDALHPSFSRTASVSLRKFIARTGTQHYPVGVLLRGCALAESEVLVACPAPESVPLEFVLTSHRLFILDKSVGEYADLAVADIAGIEGIKAPDGKSYRLDVRMGGGETRVFESLSFVPLPTALALARDLAQRGVAAAGA